MAKRRDEIVKPAPVIDGQPELDPNNAWFGVSNFNVERVRLLDNGAKLYSHYRPSQPAIYGGSNPRMKLRGVLSDVIDVGAEGISTIDYTLIKDAFDSVDYRIDHSSLPEGDKQGFGELSERIRGFIGDRRRAYVAGKIAELGGLVRTEVPNFWLRAGSVLDKTEAQRLEAEYDAGSDGYKLHVPPGGRLYSRVFQLVDVELHYGENQEPFPLPILADKFGNRGIYTGEVALYTQEAIRPQLDPATS